MKATVIAVTTEIGKYADPDFMEDAEEFAGKQAGICYMGESYFDSSVTDPVKALKRCISTIDNTHHSIIDHVKVTMLFEGLTKIGAMILNSLQDYCTSEKSGRYTVMSASSDIEQRLYDKWKDTLTTRIKEITPEIDDKTATKLGQENARYFLSVFTPSTTMSYTTSIRQYNYIIDWCNEYISSYPNTNASNITYIQGLFEVIFELREALLATDILVKGLRDPNTRHFSFLTRQTNDPMAYTSDEILKDMYRVIYQGSFVQLAQAQRHRTLKYFMQFDGVPENFYVPKMIKNTPLESEWLSDMNSVAHFIPQGTLVNIVECGYIGDFFLKCNERLCGRAQFEIMEQTCNTLMQFRESGDFSDGIQNMLWQYISTPSTDTIDISTKCIVRGGCKEHCMHGAAGALSRLY